MAIELDTTDSLVANAIRTVQELVDGNGAKPTDVHHLKSFRTERTVYPRLKVTLSWKKGEVKVHSGKSSPSGSQLHSTVAELETAMGAECDAIIESKAVAEQLARRWRLAPAREFQAIETTSKVHDMDRTHHHCSACRSCRGNGGRTCANCQHGKVDCRWCYHGRRPCASCSGGYTRYSDGTQRTCHNCNGSRFFGSCSYCSGRGRVDCQQCAGKGERPCIHCDATGSVVLEYRGWIEGTAKRRLCFSEGTTDEFKSDIGQIRPELVVARLATSTTGSVLAPAIGCGIHLSCVIPHIRSRMECKGAAVRVKTFGPDAAITKVSPFLDELLLDLHRRIVNPSSSPRDVVRAAKGTRITREILRAASSGTEFDAKELNARYRGAMSVAAISEKHAALVTARGAIGDMNAQISWLALGPLLLLLGCLSALYQVSFWFPGALKDARQFNLLVTYLWDFVLIALLLTAAWFAPKLLAYPSARPVLKQDSTRGARPLTLGIAFTVLTLGLHYGIMSSRLNAADLNLVDAAAWQPSQRLAPPAAPVVAPTHPAPGRTSRSGQMIR